MVVVLSFNIFCFLQVRQHVPHKRTFLYLEQLILRAGADAQCINIKDNHEGLDFFFANRAHGLKLIDFLQVSKRFLELC
jgi:nonsense-mediated mRNA decay protein 3